MGKIWFRKVAEGVIEGNELKDGVGFAGDKVILGCYEPDQDPFPLAFLFLGFEDVEPRFLILEEAIVGMVEPAV